MMELTQDEIDFKARFEKLSPQQRRVAGMVVSGMTSKKIGEAIGITHRTVELHRARMLHNLKCDNMFDFCYRMARYDIRREIEALAGTPT